MTNYFIHDKQYANIRARGMAGWGGDERLSKGTELVSRIFSHERSPMVGKALELGCGEGNVSRLLFEKGFDVTGVDISIVAVEWAKEKAKNMQHQIEYLQRDLSKQDALGLMKFDLVVDGNCFHCIIGKDRTVFLENVLKALNDRGVFFISSMCTKTNHDEFIELDGAPYRFIPRAGSLRSEVESAGFTVLDIQVHKREKYDHINIHLAKNC